ncbi:hypothetical protein J23TS9_04700 [Paenibacillus sp. J23TS9]|nr:hypothetical protein J23TS9_04700 [Paenibacillus sp. J23TS9]
MIENYSNQGKFGSFCAQKNSRRTMHRLRKSFNRRIFKPEGINEQATRSGRFHLDTFHNGIYPGAFQDL